MELASFNSGQEQNEDQHIMTLQDFKNVPRDVRLSMANKVLTSTSLRLRDKVPVVLIKHNKSKLKQLPRFRMLISKQQTILSILQMIRKELEDNPNYSYTMFTNDGAQVLSAVYTFEDVYYKHKSDDGFLYLQYAEQESFG